MMAEDKVVGSKANEMYLFVYHSFRHASDSRAISKEVALADIRVINRWQKVEKAKGQGPSYDMTHRITLRADRSVDLLQTFGR
jgi:hypothetical protein